MVSIGKYQLESRDEVFSPELKLAKEVSTDVVARFADLGSWIVIATVLIGLVTLVVSIALFGKPPSWDFSAAWKYR